ncbi:MAG: hypothetical protein HQL54_03695 [Magnetococcales bacterium]|nr:hypothetical protein [Magnetococcales bacterium]
MKILSLGLTLLLLLSSCSYPQSHSDTVDNTPMVQVMDAPKNSQLSVDGILFGPVYDTFEDPIIYRVIPGTHTIKITDASGNVIHQEKLFIQDERQQIRIH